MTHREAKIKEYADLYNSLIETTRNNASVQINSFVEHVRQRFASEIRDWDDEQKKAAELKAARESTHQPGLGRMGEPHEWTGDKRTLLR